MDNNAPSSSLGGGDRTDNLALSRRELLLQLLSSTNSQQGRVQENESVLGGGSQGGFPNDPGPHTSHPMPTQGDSLDALLTRSMNSSSRAAQLASLSNSPSYMNALTNATTTTPLGPSEEELLTRLLLSRLQASNRQQLLNELLRTTPISDLDDETLYRLRARHETLSSLRSQLHQPGGPLYPGRGLYGQTPSATGALGQPFAHGGASALSSREAFPYHSEQGMLRTGAGGPSRHMVRPYLTSKLEQPSNVMAKDRRDREDLLATSSMASEGELKPMELQDKKKQKRPVKRKPADMPRRPLSAYNLFFSEERERILKEMSAEEADKEKSGQEKSSDDDKKKSANDQDRSADATAEVECRALKRPLVRDGSKRRPHRKTHGKIGFKNLAQMVGQRWRSLPSERLSYYRKLAEEDTKRQKLAMEEYYKKKAKVAEDGVQKEETEKGN